MPILRACSEIAVAIVMLGIGLLGLLKLADLPQFGNAVAAWDLVPRALAPAVTIGLPLVELGLGCAWLLRWHRAPIETCALGLVVVLTGVYAMKLWAGELTGCGCLGILARRYRELESAPLAFARNGFMVLALSTSLAIRARSATRGPGLWRSRSSGAHGFTMIEMLVVIAILGVLMSLGSSLLGTTRLAARKAGTLSNLRSHATVFATYHGDYADLYPCLSRPRASYSIVRCESAGLAIRVAYFDVYRVWNIGLADQYYNGAWAGRAFQSYWDRGAGSGATGFHWSCTFLADPAYYKLETRMPPPVQLRPVRGSEVVFPGAKSLMTAYTPWVEGGLVLAGFVDGHALNVTGGRAMADLHSADGRFSSFGGHDLAYTPLTHTVDGVRGRDLR